MPNWDEMYCILLNLKKQIIIMMAFFALFDNE